MSIHKIGSDLIRPQGPKGARGAGSGTPEEIEEAARVRRPDRIDISAEGRELSAHRVGEGEVSESDLQQYRARISEAFYDKPSIAEKLAQQLLTDEVVEVVIS